MKDTVIKGNGKSRSIKAPTDMPAIFEEWRAQLLAGTATLDISLNPAGCDVVGTPLNKVNLLADDTVSILGLSVENATPNNAIAKLAGSCSVTVSLPASGWSSSAPYTQTVSVSGMTEDWVPGIPTVVLGSSVEVTDLLAATEALGCIKMIVSAAGTLTFTAPEEKPDVSLTLRVPGMVERG